MTRWSVERVVHFDLGGDFVKDGFSHFGFHDRQGGLYAVAHQRHFMGFVGSGGRLEWTVGERPVFAGTPNIVAPLHFPIFVDRFPDRSIVVSNFGDSRLYRIYPDEMKAELVVDGKKLGIRHAGNCVVDREECIWLNEVEGCRVRRFDKAGKLLLTLGSGRPGFQVRPVEFDDARFNWIYDMRMCPDGRICVLDSKNFAVRVIDVDAGRVITVAGTGRPGYDGDGGDSSGATFGGDPSARFDGPISLSLDEDGNIYVGDRFNHVVRMIERKSDMTFTIAGDASFSGDEGNDPTEEDPLRLRLPKISSMDYCNGRLFVPTDLTDQSGDLIVLRKD